MIDRRAVVGLALAALAVVVVTMWLRGGRPGEEEVTPNVVVHVDTVRSATLRRTVTAYGTVEPSPAVGGRPAAGAVITPFTDGVVAEVDAVEGRRVAAGTVLVRLDDRMARAALARARAMAEAADSAFRRQEMLIESNGTSQRAYLEAKAVREAALADVADAETGLAYMNIAAPLAGTVLHVDASVGQHVDASTRLARVVDLGRLVVTAGVPAREIGGIEVGQTVFVGEGDAGPRGTVEILGKSVDPSDGTYRVQVSVPPGASLLPGQFTEIHIVADEHSDVLVVPEESVITRPDEGTWLVAVEGDRAIHVPVTVGFRDRGLAEVSGDGVAAGMVIVTAEAYGLPTETQIRVAGG